MYSSNVCAVLVGLAMCAEYVLSLICYNCHNTAPTNTDCVKSKNCTGSACIVYEGASMAISSAFCLLILPGVIERKRRIDRQCWLEANGTMKHCICGENFCNRLRDRTYLTHIDPLSLPIQNATLVKQNPFIDYDDGNSAEENALHVRNILFSSGDAKVDPQQAADDPRTLDIDDNGLVPISHDDYIGDYFEKDSADKKSEAEKILIEFKSSAYMTNLCSSLYIMSASVIAADLLS
ncbi:hypothetical protein Tcan_04381 [Toxocara canis]|uniref:Uncharacterized protein n=1 Tax=Toxocara canis TaxID=6265 RepID=A0A0B2V883_TOXCA|nr:hypothetical protein Tcan_04381 [Toxocara canis]